MSYGFLDWKRKVFIKFGDNISWSEFIPPFCKEFSIEQIPVDCIVPHAYPVDLVLNYHMQDGWKLCRMLVCLESGTEIS